MTKALVSTARLEGQLPFLNRREALFPTRSKGSLIQWPNERQIQEVSARLARIKRMGIRLEATGDYFSSGDLAYQIQEILLATEDLIKKSQRIKR